MNESEQYQSPFSWRYGSPQMRAIWSEAHKRRTWRQIWVALAEIQAEMGLVNADALAELRSHADQVDIPRALEIEADVRHDLMAELQAFAEQVPTSGSILHLGATSTDIEDNADALRLLEALVLILNGLDRLLEALADRIDQTAGMPVIAFTHLQPAEPTTLGYRLAFTAQDLLEIRNELLGVSVRGKGFKGAVGTGASYAQLLGEDRFSAFEYRLSQQLNLEFFPVTGQTYPRLQDYRIISLLAGLAAVLHKMAFDLRLLQSPLAGELSEPFGAQQIGSSAMPFKRNPVTSEKIDSLARWLAQMPRTAWDNAALSLLERTLDDSANRRSQLPEAFLCADELLLSARQVIAGLRMDEAAMKGNLLTYGKFAALEPLLMELSRAGADRQEAHAILREHALAAWEVVARGQPNPLEESIAADARLTRWLSPQILRAALSVEGYLGIAPARAQEIAMRIRSATEQDRAAAGRVPIDRLK